MAAKWGKTPRVRFSAMETYTATDVFGDKIDYDAMHIIKRSIE